MFVYRLSSLQYYAAIMFQYENRIKYKIEEEFNSVIAVKEWMQCRRWKDIIFTLKTVQDLWQIKVHVSNLYLDHVKMHLGVILPISWLCKYRTCIISYNTNNPLNEILPGLCWWYQW